MFKLSEVAQATSGSTTAADVGVTAVCSDTRALEPGCLYVALRGANFDGHDFVETALQHGAAAVLVDAQWAAAHAAAGPVVSVADTRLALGALAAHWRQRFTLPVVGITGSNGKTTVKEMTAAILRAQAGIDGFEPAQAVLATEGNLNNDIGVPRMLFRLQAAHRAAVIEMGMNHPGEIAYLAALAKPSVGLVTNAHRAHLAGMGTVADVAREKGALFEALGGQGVAVVNADDPYCDTWARMAGPARVSTFGLGAAATVRASYRVRGLGSVVELLTPDGPVEFQLAVPGEHNVRNAAGAAAAALAAGAGLQAVAEGLAAFRGVKGRLQLHQLPGGALLLDDSYNANPDSVRAGIAVLAGTPGRKILVLGDMGEIGERSGQYHDEMGGYAKSQGIDQLFALGELAELAARNFGEGGRIFAKPADLVAALRRVLGPDTCVLVKGSRFMRMERVVNALIEGGEGKHHAA